MAAPVEAPPAFLTGADDNEKLNQLISFTHSQQAIWFLNAFWELGLDKEAETFWRYVQEMVAIDIENRENGNSLDEVEAHRFLEKLGETLTVLALRANLRKSGALGEKERPKRVPITHYLLYKYADAIDGVDYHQLVNASQGDNSAEIAKAQAMLNEVNAAFQVADQRASEAAHALNEAVSRENAAREREAEAQAAEHEAKVAEAPFKAAQEELEAALADLKAQEDSYNGKTAELKKQSEEGGVVSRNRAKVQLDAHLAEDPLPLRRAKLTLEAARKKAEKARAPFEAATKIAEAARAEASASAQKAASARAAADSAKQAADAALAEAQRQVEEAQAYLDEVKNQPGCAHGAVWWMNRALEERRRYMPSSKGGIVH
eukprot:CAMPEP_0174236788 /NCGR_PEP_ID=MMETSP0417-20130205/5861_1 /TAXON_ID=242541 /ORGANISM="Mayorella sp, Strain BSH-02190019" /LENGTH=375 /DNA_ID=CAMNT_0015315481 /DNA_START=15 /DNA_END=1142 /DNA_ORIENTATION=+